MHQVVILILHTFTGNIFLATTGSKLAQPRVDNLNFNVSKMSNYFLIFVSLASHVGYEAQLRMKLRNHSLSKRAGWPPRFGIFNTIIAIWTLVCLIGCTTTQQNGRPLTKEEKLQRDQRATVVQGHTVGTVIGAGVGGGIGFGLGMLLACLTKNERQRGAIVTTLTLAGAAAGARIGYVKGGEWGQRVARKKSEYASTEQYLGYCIDDAHRLRVKAEQENTRIYTQVQSSKQKLTTGGLSAKQRQAEVVKISNDRQQISSRVERLDLEVKAQRQVLEETGDRNKTQTERAVLRGEIAKLETEKQKLQQYNSELQQLGNRFAG